jgi:hypothetical protein
MHCCFVANRNGSRPKNKTNYLVLWRRELREVISLSADDESLMTL